MLQARGIHPFRWGRLLDEFSTGFPENDLEREFIGEELARIIHECFYCNRRDAATTSLTAGVLAAQSFNVLFQVRLSPSRLCPPVSRGVSAVSSRILVNNAG